MKKLGEHKSIFRVILVIAPLITALICIGIGRYSLTIQESFHVIYNSLIHGKESVDPTNYSVIMGIRLPRIILAILCGSGLAVAGAAFQSLFTNPMATPDTLGVAAGASFGAVLALLFGDNLIWIQVVASIMGLVAVFLTYYISKKNGKTTIIMMVLSGMVVSSMFQAFVSLVKYMADPEDKLPAITYWLMGSLSSVTFKSIMIGAPVIIIGIVIILALRWKLNVISLSEDEANTMGVNVKKIRMVIIVASTMITASVISMCGQVGWVGLLIPHISRMLVGSNNRQVIPTCISLGAVFMLVIDTVARSATPAEIPISILTATIGAPFFIALLKRTGGAWL